MAESIRQLPRTLWVGFGILLALLALFCLFLATDYSQAKRKSLPVIGDLSNFTLTNQDDQVVTLANLTNHVWVADIIFTRCAGSCPVMSTQMKSLQAALPPDSQAKLVTLTCDPGYDSPAIMKRYGERYGANFNRWMFLTGTAKELAGLATAGLKLGATPVAPQERTNPTDFFIHSTVFVVVDKEARLRGVFETEGSGEDWAKIKQQILADIQQLEGG